MVRYGNVQDRLDKVISESGGQERYSFRDYKSPYVHEVTIKDLSRDNQQYFYQVGSIARFQHSTSDFYSCSAVLSQRCQASTTGHYQGFCH